VRGDRYWRSRAYSSKRPYPNLRQQRWDPGKEVGHEREAAARQRNPSVHSVDCVFVRATLRHSILREELLFLLGIR
jgi:hypothetical protein